MLPVERIGQEHSRLFLLPFFLSFRSSLLLPLSEYKDAVLCVGLSDSWKGFSKFFFVMGAFILYLLSHVLPKEFEIIT